jgi:hypothetical protein
MATRTVNSRPAAPRRSWFQALKLALAGLAQRLRGPAGRGRRRDQASTRPAASPSAAAAAVIGGRVRPVLPPALAARAVPVVPHDEKTTPLPLLEDTLPAPLYEATMPAPLHEDTTPASLHGHLPTMPMPLLEETMPMPIGSYIATEVMPLADERKPALMTL